MNRDGDGFFVAEVNGKLIGFIACDTNWISFFEVRRVCEIHEIVVQSKWQGKGIGKTLLSKALEYAKNRGRCLVELWVGIRNYRAIKFYEKNGLR
jgi:ribosomal protein S18 acetylase RimI-like enzyme